MISYHALLVTLGILLGIVVLTTFAAIVNKIHAVREAGTRQATLERLRQAFLLLPEPTARPIAHREIANALGGRWGEIAAGEIAELELTLRLDVIQAMEGLGLVARFLREARSRMKWTRARSLRILGDLKVPASVPALLTALEDRDADVRNVAARSLGRMRLQAAEEALVSILGKNDQAVSARIAAICIEMGPRTAPLLIRALRDGPPRARFWAARILGEIRDARAVRSLGDALLDPDDDARSAAVWALGQCADRATGPLVEPLLRDPRWFVRAHAAETLGKLGDGEYAPALGTMLRDSSWWVRRNAMDALVALRDASLPVLTKAYHGDDRFARDCAIEALTTLGAPPPGVETEGRP